LRISKKRNQRPFIGTRENVEWDSERGSDKRSKDVLDQG
jgi:hypothetical protein